MLYRILRELQLGKKTEWRSTAVQGRGSSEWGKETEVGKVFKTPRPFLPPKSASHRMAFGFSAVGNGFPSAYQPYYDGVSPQIRF
jgi:hypothetical protein